MPGPAFVGIYVVAAAGAAAAGYTFYKFVYTPHIAPKVQFWKEEVKARQAARLAQRNSRRLASPHGSHEDRSMNERRSNDSGSLVELESLGSVSKSSTFRGSASGSRLRQRHRRTTSDETRVMDEVYFQQIGNIPYAPLAPTPASSALFTKVIGLGSESPKVPFTLGTETAAPSPRQVLLPINGTPPRSPEIQSPYVQLPTPPTDSPTSSHFRSLTPPPFPPPALLQSPSMTGTHSQSSALSFNTARSAISPALTEFHSLSPSQPGSPFTDTMSFSSVSGDEELFNDFHVRSTDSLMRVQSHESHRDHTGGAIGVDDFSDRFELSSEASWEDVSEGHRSGAASPRH